MAMKLDDHNLLSALAAEIALQIGAASINIHAAQPAAGNALQENWYLDVAVEGGPHAGPGTWVLRTDASARLTISLDRETEAKILRAVHNAGVMAAVPLAITPRGEALGKPYTIQPRLDGSSEAHRIVRDKSLGAFGDTLARALASELARIHSIAAPRADLACLPLPMQPPARAEVARLRAALSKSAEPRPALEYILAWLDRHAPPPRPLTLVHGDFRTGNYLVHEGRLAGILGWELSHWGDADEDIGWLSARCWRFGNDKLEAGGIAPLDAFLDAYAIAAGRRPSADAVRYWQIMAAGKWATMTVLQGDRVRVSDDARLELALTGLMPAEMEHDALSDILAWRGNGDGGPQWP